MKECILANNNRNTHIVVADYDDVMVDKLKGKAVVFYVNDANQISRVIQTVSKPTKLCAVIYENPKESMETVEIDKGWGGMSVILKINRIGEFGNVIDKVNILRTLNVIVIFSGDILQSVTDAKILASLGIHSGIELREADGCFEEASDLISYTFYGMMPHAAIEPFSTMEHYYCGNNYVSPALANFENPNRYIHVDIDGNLAFSRDELKRGIFFDKGWDLIPDISQHPAVFDRIHSWQKLFIEGDRCTFCPAFRVCCGFFKMAKENGACVPMMNDLLDGIEFYKKQPTSNDLCQL